ncbi:hypothetical protein PUMCH_002761 [Australozyma saopauloensis]|uniref:Mediator of RNA polymerase II transcription subunit 21 n=1 Tax=Australozyma saopauloensis TaxID=291208 RepID=A0AAX4HAJ6_9ASCO|nr:hypothetical protein PUMCH_002761 [[Candida] saopauloensis]
MTDRLTQLQACLDQLVAQFNATINYINTQSDMALLDEDPQSTVNLAAKAPLPGKKESEVSGGEEGMSRETGILQEQAGQGFENVVNELSTDIILKSRQISMIIDSLPGIGTLPETQLKVIGELLKELEEAEQARLRLVKEKDQLLEWCESLIVDVSQGIYKTRL